MNCSSSLCTGAPFCCGEAEDPSLTGAPYCCTASPSPPDQQIKEAPVSPLVVPKPSKEALPVPLALSCLTAAVRSMHLLLHIALFSSSCMRLCAYIFALCCCSFPRGSSRRRGPLPLRRIPSSIIGRLLEQQQQQ